MEVSSGFVAQDADTRDVHRIALQQISLAGGVTRSGQGAAVAQRDLVAAVGGGYRGVAVRAVLQYEFLVGPTLVEDG